MNKIRYDQQVCAELKRSNPLIVVGLYAVCGVFCIYSLSDLFNSLYPTILSIELKTDFPTMALLVGALIFVVTCIWIFFLVTSALIKQIRRSTCKENPKFALRETSITITDQEKETTLNLNELAFERSLESSSLHQIIIKRRGKTLFKLGFHSFIDSDAFAKIESALIDAGFLSE